VPPSWGQRRTMFPSSDRWRFSPVADRVSASVGLELEGDDHGNDSTIPVGNLAEIGRSRRSSSTHEGLTEVLVRIAHRACATATSTSGLGTALPVPDHLRPRGSRLWSRSRPGRRDLKPADHVCSDSSRLWQSAPRVPGPLQPVRRRCAAHARCAATHLPPSCLRRQRSPTMSAGHVRQAHRGQQGVVASRSSTTYRWTSVP